MSRKTLQSRKKEVAKKYSMSTQLGKNMRDKVVPTGVKRDQSAIDAIVKWSIQTINLSKSGKAKSFNLTYQPGPASNGKVLGNCQVCGKAGLKKASRLGARVNGKQVYSGNNGPLVGRECEKHMVHIFEGAQYKKFRMYEQDSRERTQARDKTARATLKLDQLSRKIVNKLQKRGYDLESEIGADAVRAVQKSILKGDYSGLERETDPAKARDMIRWGLAHRNEKGCDKDIYHTLTLLEHKPQNVTPEQWAQFALYYWQERKWDATGELAGTKDDILYLEKLDAEHPIIKEYGRIDRKQRVTPVKAFSKARWQEVNIGDLLEADSVTKAQARALRNTAGLVKKRESHNRELMNAYCDHREFDRLLGNLREKYHSEKKKFRAAKEAGVRAPEIAWNKSDYKSLRNFFDEEEKVTNLNNISTRDYVLGFVPMPQASETVRTLFVEGRKLDLAQQKNDERILKQSYVSMHEAGTHIHSLDYKLDRLLNSVIEFDNMPPQTADRIRKTGMTKNNIKKTIEELRETSAHGIIPTRYVQPQKNKPSILERTLKIAEDYSKIDADTANKLEYLTQLENELDVKFVDVRAEDGRTARRKKDARFKTSAFAGKKYITAEQKKAVENLYNTLSFEIKEIDIPKAKKAAEEVEKFYKEHTIYTGSWFRKDELREQGFTIKHKPFKQYIEKAEEIQKFKKGEQSQYIKPNQKLKERISGIKHKIYRDIDKILADDKTLVTQKLVDGINSEYQTIASRVIVEGYDKYENPRMNYFDIVVDRTRHENDKEDHRIRAAFGPKRNQGKPLLRWTPEKRQFGKLTVEPHEKFGTWYGRGRTRDYLDKLCAKADEQRIVYLRIVGARR